MERMRPRVGGPPPQVPPLGRSRSAASDFEQAGERTLSATPGGNSPAASCSTVHIVSHVGTGTVVDTMRFHRQVFKSDYHLEW